MLEFDARDNNISVVGSTFQSIFYNDENDKSKRDDNRYALFSGNPVCHTDINLKNSFSCEKMCSKYCWYKKEEVDQGDGRYCNAECNIEECNYDQGVANIGEIIHFLKDCKLDSYYTRKRWVERIINKLDQNKDGDLTIYELHQITLKTSPLTFKLTEACYDKECVARTGPRNKRI